MPKSRLIDIPVQNKEDESLGVGIYADILARFIMNCETPITIGIQGDWGIGKTSMLNMVQEMLSPRQALQAKYHVIYFNTWQYAQFQQEEFLSLSILKGIMTEVQNLESLKELQKDEKVKEALKRFGGVITKLGIQIVNKHTGIDLDKALSNADETGLQDTDLVIQIRKMKTEFSVLVNALMRNERDRLVIMIDDLDRIRPVRALEFLEAIKNFLDVESCVFIIAVDYSVIQNGMIEKLGQTAQELQGKSYFDKIIQIPFTMPSSSYQTDKYIMSLLGWNYLEEENKYIHIEEERERYFLKVRAKSISKQDVEFFTNITGLTVGNNPRSIKRTINYANLLRLVVQSRRSASREEGTRSKEWTMEDAKVLYPLACMQLAWPELFDNLANEPNPGTLALMQDFDYLQKLRGMNILFKRIHNQEVTMSNITGFIDEFIGLVDNDGDGQVNTKEFAPIWEMMVDANLTTAKNKSLEDDWKKLKKIIVNNMGRENGSDLVKNIFTLFRDDKSLWNDSRNFNLLSAGKKFFNIIWGRKQIGSFVSTQSMPAQLYLKGNWKIYSENVVDEVKDYLFDVHSIGHYGTGDTRVDIIAIANRSDGVALMNSIFEAMKSNLIE